MADIYAKLPRDQQFIIVSKEESKKNMEHDIQSLKDSKVYLLEEEQKFKSETVALMDFQDKALYLLAQNNTQI